MAAFLEVERKTFGSYSPIISNSSNSGRLIVCIMKFCRFHSRTTHFQREDTLEEEIRQCQEELRNSEENCRYISKTCDDKLDE